MVRSTTLQGLEHVGQTEDLGNIIIFAAILTSYQLDMLLASYQETVDKIVKILCVEVRGQSERSRPPIKKQRHKKLLIV